MGELPFRCQLSRQLVQFNGLENGAEDVFIETLGEQKLGETPFGLRPGRRNDEHDRLAPVSRTAQRLLPPLSGQQTALGIKIQKDIIPPVLGEPVPQGDCLTFVDAGVAQEDSGHGKPFGSGNFLIRLLRGRVHSRDICHRQCTNCPKRQRKVYPPRMIAQHRQIPC